MDTFKPSDFATWSWTTGCSCLWSPINTICLAPEHVIGTSDSGSMHMPHSSTMHCCTLSHEVTILRLPAVTHVQRTICTPDCSRAQRSAVPINYTRDGIKCLRVSNDTICNNLCGRVSVLFSISLDTFQRSDFPFPIRSDERVNAGNAVEIWLYQLIWCWSWFKSLVTLIDWWFFCLKHACDDKSKHSMHRNNLIYKGARFYFEHYD